jgi:hypothetical protein
VGLQPDCAWEFMKQAREEPEAVLEVMADPHPDLIKKARGAVKPGTKFYTDYVRMLDEVKADAVLSTTHLEIVRLQEPMATNVKNAKEMKRLARDAASP